MVRSRIVKGLGSTVFAALLAASALLPGSAHAEDATAAGVAPAARKHLPFKKMHFPGDPVPEANPSPAAGGALTYQGGPVISSAQVVAVMWGSTTATQLTFAKGFFPAVMASTYIDALSEYSTVGQAGGTGQKVVRGGFVGASAITPSASAGGNTVDDSAIGTELGAQINAGHLPKPTYDAQGYTNTLYVIFFAPGITITQQGSSSCQAFCGYHGSWSYSGKSTPYAVIPDMGSSSNCAQGCGGGGETGALGGTVSHEVSEAITDEGVADNKVAWYDNTDNGEIGDICDTGGSKITGVGGTGTIGGYTVQYEYSNSKGVCELDNTSIGPQGGCTKNADCAAPTPVCLTAKSTCVQCAANSDCSGATPICDTTANTCRACTGNADCSGATPVCALGGGDAGASTDPNAGKCVQCTTNSACTTAAPICKNDTCGGCTSNTDCTDPTNNTCNTTSGACGPAPSSSGSGGGSGSGSGGSGSGGNGSGSGGNGSGSGGNGSGSGGNGSGSGGNGSGSGGGNTDDGGPGSSNNSFTDGGSSSAGCGCVVAGAPASSGLGIAGVLFGLAVAAGRGRRTRKNRA